MVRYAIINLSNLEENDQLITICKNATLYTKAEKAFENLVHKKEKYPNSVVVRI